MSKFRPKTGEVDLEDTPLRIPKAGSPEIRRIELNRLDRGVDDTKTEFKLPEGGAQKLGNIRFENGGVRKDFGLVNVGSAAPQTVRDIAPYEFVDPLATPPVRTRKLARIYVNASGKAAIEFLSGGAWGAPTASTEDMRDVPVSATSIGEFLCWADGDRIHFYTESTEPTKASDEFTNTHAGTPGTGPNGELVAVGEEHRVTITNTPIDGDTVTFNWRTEAIQGMGYVDLVIEYFDGVGWNELFKRHHFFIGARVWEHESQSIQDRAGMKNTLFRIRITNIVNVFTFDTPTVKVVGFGADATTTEPAPGAQYFYLPPISTEFGVFDSPGADFVFSFEDRLIGLGGRDNPKRIIGSADGRPRVWNRLDENRARTGAFEYVFLDHVTDPMDDMVAGGKVAENTAAILRKRSILRAEETGRLEAPLRIQDWIDGIGTESPKSLVQVPNGICFLGHDFIPYYFDGSAGPVPVGAPIHQTLIETLREEDLPFVESKYDQKFGEWWLLIRENGSATATAWWIFSLSRFIATQELVWRRKPVVGDIACEPAVTAPPPDPAPPAEPSPPTGGGSGPEPPLDQNPPETEEQALGGKPFEIIYGNEYIWVGLLGTALASDPILEIFDARTGLLTRTISRTDMGRAGTGYGAAYHPTRNEIWHHGSTSGGSTPSIVVMDADTFAVKVTYDYPQFSDTTIPRPIEYCPATGDMYIGGFQAKDASGNVTATVARIDASNGNVVATQRPAVRSDVAEEGIVSGFVAYITYNSTQGEMLAGLLRDHMWAFDPSTMAITRSISRPLDGLIDKGGEVPENSYDVIDDKIWATVDVYDPVYVLDRGPLVDGSVTLGDTNGRVATFNGGQEDPSAAFVEYIPEIGLAAVSRGYKGLLFADPTTKGLVTLYDVRGNPIRTIQTDFHPARATYAPVSGSLFVNAHWNIADNTYHVQAIPLGETSRPDKPEIPRTPDTPPERPPSQPVNPTQPAPTPEDPGSGIREPEPDPLPSPGSDQPKITAARPYCEDNMVDGGGGNWTGDVRAGVEVDYIESSDFAGDPILVYLFPTGADPANDAPAIPQSVGVDVDADTKRFESYRETHTVAVTTAEKPQCDPTGDREAFDQFFDVRIRQGTVAGGFSQFSNKVPVRVRIVRSELAKDTDPATVDPTVGAPSFISAGVVCVPTGNVDEPSGPYTGTLRKSVTVDAIASADGKGDNLLIQCEEYAAGDTPGVDTPLRTKISDNLKRTFFNFPIWFVEVSGAASTPTCAVPSGSSTPAVTRDYYLRHVLGGGSFGPRSGVSTVTIEHPGP